VLRLSSGAKSFPFTAMYRLDNPLNHPVWIGNRFRDKGVEWNSSSFSRFSTKVRLCVSTFRLFHTFHNAKCRELQLYRVLLNICVFKLHPKFTFIQNSLWPGFTLQTVGSVTKLDKWVSLRVLGYEVYVLLHNKFSRKAMKIVYSFWYTTIWRECV
jgi:hypothetical protein